LIKYIKSVLWRVAKCLSYIEEARCLKVNGELQEKVKELTNLRSDAGLQIITKKTTIRINSTETSINLKDEAVEYVPE